MNSNYHLNLCAYMSIKTLPVRRSDPLFTVLRPVLMWIEKFSSSLSPS